jgi:hypothetical protein
LLVRVWVAVLEDLPVQGTVKVTATMDDVHVAVDLGPHCARARHRAQAALRAVLARSLHFLDAAGMTLNASKSHAWATVTGVRDMNPEGGGLPAGRSARRGGLGGLVPGCRGRLPGWLAGAQVADQRAARLRTRAGQVRGAPVGFAGKFAVIAAFAAGPGYVAHLLRPKTGAKLLVHGAVRRALVQGPKSMQALEVLWTLFGPGHRVALDAQALPKGAEALKREAERGLYDLESAWKAYDAGAARGAWWWRGPVGTFRKGLQAVGWSWPA